MKLRPCITSPNMSLWYKKETSALKKNTDNVLEKKSVMALLHKMDPSMLKYEGQIPSNEEETSPPSVLKDIAGDESGMSKSPGKVFVSPATKMFEAESLKFHLFNYEGSDIATNIMKCAKTFILVK